MTASPDDTPLRLRLRRGLRRRPGPQGQPGLRVRRSLAARRLRRRRRRGPRRHRLLHRDPAAAPARRAAARPRRPARPGSPAPSTAPTTGSSSWSRRTRRSTAPAPPRPSRSSTAPGSAIGHIGDSRAYLFRGGDHHPAHQRPHVRADLIDEGRITEEEARVHPHRNLILRAIDGVRDTEPDLFYVELAPGDRLLLCSDGACGVLDDARMADILGHRQPRLRRGRAGPRQPRGRQHRQRHLRRRRRRRRARREEPLEPLVVGAAAELPRRNRGGVGGLFRGHRRGDTGELDPVPAEVPTTPSRNDPIDPEVVRYAPRPPRRFAWLEAARRRSPWSSGWSGWPPRRRGPGARTSTTSASTTARSTIFRGVNADLPGLDPAARPTRPVVDRARPAQRLRRPTRSARASTPTTSTTPAAPSRTSPPTPIQPHGAGTGTSRRRPQRGHRRLPGRPVMSQKNPRGRPGPRFMGFVHRRRRGAELFLLILALVVGIGAYAAVGLGVEGTIPPDILAYGGWLAAADRRATSWSGWSRRTPTRCCCRSSPRSTGSGSR